MTANNIINIKAFEDRITFCDRVAKDTVKKYTLDFGAWVEENSNLSSIKYTVKSGTSADISASEAIDSTQKSIATITFSQSGTVLIKATANASDNQVIVLYLKILVTEPENYEYPSDYRARYIY